MSLPRDSGILLHITSLPGPHGSGDLGAAAYHFVDWLVGAQQGLWQILPLGGVGPGNSPYMSSSAFAGNVLLIDLHELLQRGWLREADLAVPPTFSDMQLQFDAVIPWRMARLQQAAQAFAQSSNAADQADFAAFCDAQAHWLHDYALFMALVQDQQQQVWNDWPQALAQRDSEALRAAEHRLAHEVTFWKFCQWCFARQWKRLRAYANGRGVRIVGDAPLFVAHQSADVWTHQNLFELEASGAPRVVAGVPPDYFSATGQRWGNPLYRWQAHADEGYAWWIARVRQIFEWVDVVRIDHFRGLAAYWEIPASAPTAEHGRWLPGPGAALFHALQSALGTTPIIAEDLGTITPDVEALRTTFAFPGMRVLHFAFGEGRPEDNRNAYLPHNYDANTVVYTGTHDNNTTLGWWHDIAPAMRQHVRDYTHVDEDDVPWSLMRLAAASVANTVIHPMQDVLGLDASHRMNTPGNQAGCWQWRFGWSQVTPLHAQRLARMGDLFRRPLSPPRC